MAMKFIPATNFRPSRVRAVRLVVIHDMEYPERSTSAEWCAGYFRGSRAPMASAHYYIDNDSVVQGVKEEHTAYAAPGVNADGIQLEHAGYARQTRAEWLDTYSLQMLKNESAPLVAQICARHKLPMRHLSNAELASGARGIIGHWQASQVYKLSDHHDPGPNFPWNDYIGWVVANGSAKGSPASAPASAPTDPRGPFPLAKGHWYGPDDGTWRSHSGFRVADRYAIKLIQNKVKVTPSGRYQSQTFNGVKVWQKANGLVADGLVGPKTWARM